MNYKETINSCIRDIKPTKEQLLEAIESVITLKENEIVLEGYLYKDKPYSKGDARYELLALYEARNLFEMNNEIKHKYLFCEEDDCLGE